MNILRSGSLLFCLLACISIVHGYSRYTGSGFVHRHASKNLGGNWASRVVPGIEFSVENQRLPIPIALSSSPRRVLLHGKFFFVNLNAGAAERSFDFKKNLKSEKCSIKISKDEFDSSLLCDNKKETIEQALSVKFRAKLSRFPTLPKPAGFCKGSTARVLVETKSNVLVCILFPKGKGRETFTLNSAGYTLDVNPKRHTVTILGRDPEQICNLSLEKTKDGSYLASPKCDKTEISQNTPEEEGHIYSTIDDIFGLKDIQMSFFNFSSLELSTKNNKAMKTQRRKARTGSAKKSKKKIVNDPQLGQPHDDEKISGMNKGEKTENLDKTLDHELDSPPGDDKTSIPAKGKHKRKGKKSSLKQINAEEELLKKNSPGENLLGSQKDSEENKPSQMKNPLDKFGPLGDRERDETEKTTMENPDIPVGSHTFENSPHPKVHKGKEKDDQDSSIQKSNPGDIPEKSMHQEIPPEL